MVKARFYVAEVTQQAYGGYAPPAPAGRVKLQASTKGEENKEWASATPAGSFEMTIKSGPAFQFFLDRIGQDVSITIDDVE